jgi:restriction endonuclease Mrr
MFFGYYDATNDDLKYATNAEPDISVSPAILNFGQAVVGDLLTKIITISSTDNANLVISSIERTGYDAGMFSMAKGGPNPCSGLTPTKTSGGN